MSLMGAVEPASPTFLISHIQHGNTLGTTPDLMGRGVPDATWVPFEAIAEQGRRTEEQKQESHQRQHWFRTYGLLPRTRKRSSFSAPSPNLRQPLTRTL